MTSTCIKDGHTVKDAPKLPLNLLDALREYEKDKELQVALGSCLLVCLPQAEA